MDLNCGHIFAICGPKYSCWCQKFKGDIGLCAFSISNIFLHGEDICDNVAKSQNWNPSFSALKL